MSSRFKARLIAALSLAIFSAVAFATDPYSPSDGFISPIENQLLPAAVTAPQASMAVVVEDICPPSLGFITNNDLQTRCSEMVVAITTGGEADQADALDGLQALAPEEDAVIGTTQLDAANAQVDNIGERITNVRGGATLGGGLTYNGSSDFEWGVGGAGDGGGRWGFFVNGLYANTDRDQTDRESGFESDDYGFTAGVDYAFSNKFLVGAAFGYKDGDADIDNNGGNLETESYSGFLYWSIFPDDFWYVDAILGYTSNEHDQDRRLSYTIAGIGAAVGTVTTVNQSALSDTDSEEWSASIMVGRNFFLNNWVVSPYGRFEYADVEIEAYRESMSNPTAAGSGLALQIDGQDYESMTATAGGSLSTAFASGIGMIYPQVTVEYVHEFENDNDPTTGRFVNETSGRTFAILKDRPDRNFFNIGASLTAAFSDATTGFFRYQALVGYRDLSVHAFEIGIRQTF